MSANVHALTRARILAEVARHRPRRRAWVSRWTECAALEREFALALSAVAVALGVLAGQVLPPTPSGHASFLFALLLSVMAAGAAPMLSDWGRFRRVRPADSDDADNVIRAIDEQPELAPYLCAWFLAGDETLTGAEAAQLIRAARILKEAANREAQWNARLADAQARLEELGLRKDP